MDIVYQLASKWANGVIKNSYLSITEQKAFIEDMEKEVEKSGFDVQKVASIAHEMIVQAKDRYVREWKSSNGKWHVRVEKCRYGYGADVTNMRTGQEYGYHSYHHSPAYLGQELAENNKDIPKYVINQVVNCAVRLIY